MLVALIEMNENLNSCYTELTSQNKLDISDDEKIENLRGVSTYFNTDNKLYAYDYLNRFNHRLDKVEKMYNQIKELG